MSCGRHLFSLPISKYILLEGTIFYNFVGFLISFEINNLHIFQGEDYKELIVGFNILILYIHIKILFPYKGADYEQL